MEIKVIHDTLIALGFKFEDMGYYSYSKNKKTQLIRVGTENGSIFASLETVDCQKILEVEIRLGDIEENIDLNPLAVSVVLSLCNTGNII